MPHRINKRTVDALKPGPRDTFLWDPDLPGFGLRCRPSGAKHYVLKYRFAGRQRWITIGRHGAPWVPDEARQKAKQLLGVVADGIDPAERREETRRDLTVSELCDLFLAEGAMTLKPATRAIYKSGIDRHVRPLLGRRKVRSVTRGDVERFMLAVAHGETATDERTGPRGRAIVRGGQGIAGRVVAYLGSVFSFAVRRGLRPDNPVTGIRTFKRDRQERFLSSAELARLGDALATVEQEGMHRATVAAIRLLLLTGCRKSEILGLEWAHVDFERRCLRLPMSKTGAKTVPLGAAAMEILADLRERKGKSVYVLPATRGDGHLVGLPKAWSRIRTAAGLDGVRLHDLRHSFATVAVAGGESLYLTGKVLGHRNSRTTEGYAHLADRTSARIAAALKGGKDDGSVIALDAHPSPRRPTG